MAKSEHINVGFGMTGTESYTLELDKSDKDDIIKQVPDSIPFNVSGLFTVNIPIDPRPAVRQVLDHLPSPKVKCRFQVKGSCKDFDAIEIECVSYKILGTHQYNIQVVNVGATAKLYAEVDAEEYYNQKCKKKDQAGLQKRRKFHVTWYMDLEVNPGFAGTYPLDEFDVIVSCPCCPGAVEEEEEDDPTPPGTEHEKSEDGKHK
jgi:hypothetical protein